MIFLDTATGLLRHLRRGLHRRGWLRQRDGPRRRRHQRGRTQTLDRRHGGGEWKMTLDLDVISSVMLFYILVYLLSELFYILKQAKVVKKRHRKEWAVIDKYLGNCKNFHCSQSVTVTSRDCSTIPGSPLSRGHRRLRRGRRARQVEGAHAPRHLHQEERLRQGKRKLRFGGLLTKISSAWVISLICGTKMTNVSASFMRQN